MSHKKESKDTTRLPQVACGNYQLIGAKYDSAAAKVAKGNLNWVLPVDLILLFCIRLKFDNEKGIITFQFGFHTFGLHYNAKRTEQASNQPTTPLCCKKIIEIFLIKSFL